MDDRNTMQRRKQRIDDSSDDDDEGSEHGLLLRTDEIMDERQMDLRQTSQLIRKVTRDLFGPSFYDECGFFLDRHLSARVHRFGYWVDIPRGHYTLDCRKDFKVSSLAMSTGGRLLFAGSKFGLLTIWDLQSNSQLDSWEAHNGEVSCLTHNRGFLVSGGLDKSVRVWNGISHRLIHNLQHTSTSVLSVAINSAATLVASGLDDMLIHLWSLHNGKLLRTITAGYSDRVRSVHFLVDASTLILSGSSNREIKTWDIKSGCMQRSFSDLLSYELRDLDTNCDGSLMAACYDDGFTLMRLPDLNLVRSMRSCATTLRFHPMRPQVLAVGGRMNQIEIYNFERGGWIHSFGKHDRSVSILRFSNDGSHLVSICDGLTDSCMKMWDMIAVESRYRNRWEYLLNEVKDFINRIHRSMKKQIWDAFVKEDPFVKHSKVLKCAMMVVFQMYHKNEIIPSGRFDFDQDQALRVVSKLVPMILDSFTDPEVITGDEFADHIGDYFDKAMRVYGSNLKIDISDL